jgi:hypothetical protein
MSSSFTDQPPPDPQGDAGYTSMPPVRGRPTDAPREEGAEMPRLGSLTQQARVNQLQRARIILFIVGALTIVWNVIDIATIRSTFQNAVEKEIQKRGGPGVVQIDRRVLQQEEDKVFMFGCAVDGALILVGILFLIFGAIIYHFPVPVTITSLILYVLVTVAGMVLLSLSDEPAPARSGIIVKILIIIALAKSIQSALAYEKERRAQEEYGPP